MASVVQSDPNVSKCMLTLYHMDKRVSDTKWCSAIKVSFSKETATKASDLVSSYFVVDEDWDKKLLKSIFLDDINFNWFEFSRKNNPDTILGVKISGDRRVIFNESPEEFYVPVKRLGKLSVSTKFFTANNYDELDYDQIRERRNRDYSVVALFNSNSFQSITECSTNLGFSRKLERIDGSSMEKKS